MYTDHPVSDDEAWGGGEAGEHAQRVSRVHYQGLIIPHLTQVLHHQPELANNINQQLNIWSITVQLVYFIQKHCITNQNLSQ